MMEDTGYVNTPEHYDIVGREAIDIIRDAATDKEFATWCRLTALKYKLRAGRKGGPDEEKMFWYLMMADHVLRGSADPREKREDFEGYTRMTFDGVKYA